MKFSYSTLIKRPLSEVFAYISCYENDPFWSEIILEASQLREGSPEVGLEFRRVIRLLGRNLPANAQIIEYVPGTLICCKSFSGLVPQVETRLCRPAKDGTNFTLRVENFRSDFLNLPVLTLARIFQRQLITDVCTLKDLLETQE